MREALSRNRLHTYISSRVTPRELQSGEQDLFLLYVCLWEGAVSQLSLREKDPCTNTSYVSTVSPRGIGCARRFPSVQPARSETVRTKLLCHTPSRDVVYCLVVPIAASQPSPQRREQELKQLQRLGRVSEMEGGLCDPGSS